MRHVWLVLDDPDLEQPYQIEVTDEGAVEARMADLVQAAFDDSPDYAGVHVDGELLNDELRWLVVGYA